MRFILYHKYDARKWCMYCIWWTTNIHSSKIAALVIQQQTVIVPLYFHNNNSVSDRFFKKINNICKCSIHFLHQLSSKWIILMNFGFNKMKLAALLINLFSCCMICLERTSYPKDSRWCAYQDHLTYHFQIYYFGAILRKDYINNPQIYEDIKQNIRQVIDTISQDILSFVMNAVVKREQLVIDAGGRHLKSVTLHT